MKIFKITGSFKMGVKKQNFSRETLAETEKAAVEKLLSDFGGKHGLSRKDIQIKEVKAIGPEEVESLVLKQMIEHKMV